MIGILFSLFKDKVDLIFNIINVIILLALGFFIFRRYALPSIKTALEDYSNYLKNIKNKTQVAIKNQDLTKKEIKQQDILCEDLKSKVVFWKKYVEEQRENNLQEQKAINQSIKQVIYKQDHNYTKELITKKTILQVKELLNRKLSNYFTQEKKEHYIDNIVDNLK